MSNKQKRGWAGQVNNYLKTYLGRAMIVAQQNNCCCVIATVNLGIKIASNLIRLFNLDNLGPLQ